MAASVALAAWIPGHDASTYWYTLAFYCGELAAISCAELRAPFGRFGRSERRGLLALSLAGLLYRRVTTGGLCYSPEVAREILSGTFYSHGDKQRSTVHRRDPSIKARFIARSWLDSAAKYICRACGF